VSKKARPSRAESRNHASAYGAERTLARTIAEIPAGVADRLILVDDASPDNTAQVARELGVEVHVHRENLGYGGNQKTCYIEALASGADIVVLLHPDYQYEPKAVPLLIAPILAGDADMTFGSRFAGLGDPIGGGMPLYRYVGNRVTTIAENGKASSSVAARLLALRAAEADFARLTDELLERGRARRRHHGAWLLRPRGPAETTAGVCDDCADAIFDRRAQTEEPVAA
jgi:glycosyltransferase involved in cell wall biosynthesis